MGKFVWKITPATGWTLVSAHWVTTLIRTTPTHGYQEPVRCKFRLTRPELTGSRSKWGNTTCGIDSLERVICVTKYPQPHLHWITKPVAHPEGECQRQYQCGYLWTEYISVDGNLCGHQWLPAGHIKLYLCRRHQCQLTKPAFQFHQPGVYTIQLQTIAPAASCSSTVVTQQVTVKGKPVLTLGGIPTDICQGQSINPSVTATCYIDAATTYSWTFPSGSPASSGNQAPGTITYSTTGTFNIGLAVTNECGVTNASATIPVNPTPVISGPANVCVGSTITLAGSGTAATGNPWTSSNTSIATVSSTGVVTGISQGTVTITFTNSSNCTDDATVTVNALPVITGPSVVCVGTSITLTGSASPSATTPWASSNTGWPR